MSASLISFRLARAQRPHLHKDRNSNLLGTQFLLSYAPDRQLVSTANTLIQKEGSLDPESSQLAGVTAQLQLVKDQYQLYLGEACVFYLTLSNQGSTSVSDITIKIEFVVEGGSSSLLYDSGPKPLPLLPVSGRHDVIVNTDIKEQGAIQLVASAVFTDHSGERKYHVQFFKLASSSPLSVRTRVRCLPHIQAPSGGGSSTGDMQKLHTAALATRGFLEVSVENATQLPLVLHAVRLLPVAGITAQQLPMNEQQQQQGLHTPAGTRQQHQYPQKRSSSGGGVTAADQGDSDTQQQHDIEDASAGDKQPQLQKTLSSGFDQLQLEQQQQQQHEDQVAVLGPCLQDQVADPLVIVPPAGSHNYLWQVDHYLPAPQNGSLGPAASSSSSSSSNLLGRLELHWSNNDGKTGRLLTQPLSGPATGWHRDVLLQLTQLQPLASTAAGSAHAAASDQAAAGEAATAASSSAVDAIWGPLAVGELVSATLSLTAAAAVGPLLVLHTELTPTRPPAAGVGGTRISSSGGAGQQQDSSSSSVTQQKLSASQPHSSSSSSSDGASSGKVHPEIAVQGARTQRVPQLLPGESAKVQFVLLPLRPGWVRLPTFVVVSETDGRLLDSVHDVYLLVG